MDDCVHDQVHEGKCVLCGETERRVGVWCSASVPLSVAPEELHYWVSMHPQVLEVDAVDDYEEL